MTKTTCMLWTVAALLLTVAAPSTAQTPPEQTPPPSQTPTQTPPAPRTRSTTPLPTKNFFIDVNGGLQAASHSITATSTPIIYDEPASISTSQDIGSGALFDIGLGYRVWHDLAVSIGFTSSSSKSDATVVASIPDPIFTDRPVTRNLTASGLKHSERAVHIDLVWSRPINDKMDAALSFGPSIIKVSQGLVTTVNVAPGTQDATAAVDTQSKTAVGFNIGGDVTYLFQPRVGVGAMARYVIGKVDLASVQGLTVGGFQIGGGVRLRF
jgi:hypothetical protein